VPYFSTASLLNCDKFNETVWFSTKRYSVATNFANVSRALNRIEEELMARVLSCLSRRLPHAPINDQHASEDAGGQFQVHVYMHLTCLISICSICFDCRILIILPVTHCFLLCLALASLLSYAAELMLWRSLFVSTIVKYEVSQSTKTLFIFSVYWRVINRPFQQLLLNRELAKRETQFTKSLV